MKTKSLIIICALCLITQYAHALSSTIGGGSINRPARRWPNSGGPTCSATTCQTSGVINEQYMCTGNGNCNTFNTKTCYTGNGKTYAKVDCAVCKPGYTKVSKSTSCPNVTCQTCECICSNCESESDKAYGTGYLRSIARWCECGTGTAVCKSSTSYRCAAGYYGTSSNGTSGCTKCPTGPNGEGTTSAVGDNATAARCYIPAGTTATDSTGTFTYTTKCYNG